MPSVSTPVSLAAVAGVATAAYLVYGGSKRSKKSRGRLQSLKGLLADQGPNAAWDYIIVGGGSAGCVMAKRLSEDPSIRVLVLEQGVSDEHIGSRLPVGYGDLWFNPDTTLQLFTTPQSACMERKMFQPRGKATGGCSTINAMMYHRGPAGDYDDWAELSGNQDWSYDKLLPYFKRSEGFQMDTVGSKEGCAKNHFTTTPDPKYHNVNGEWKTGYANYFHGVSELFIDACRAVGFPLNKDFNAESTSGVGRVQTFISSGNGVRSSTARAFLTKDVLARDNLDVVIGVTARKLVFDGTKCTGVEVDDKDVKLHTFNAKTEVILSAGAFASPQLLMLSGIGPADELKKHNIDVLVDSPKVGKGLKDHLGVPITFKAPKGYNTLDLPAPEPLKGLVTQVVPWLLTGKGRITSNVGETALFFRLEHLANGKKAILHDAHSRDGIPDIEVIGLPCFTTNHRGLVNTLDVDEKVDKFAKYITLVALLLDPKSTGEVTLQSADPHTPPIINPHYLEDEADVNRFVKAVELMREIADHGYSKIGIGALEEVHYKSDGMISLESTKEIIRRRAETYYHPTSTAAMGKEKTSVTDPYLRVRGVSNLRVADASVFPKLTAGHTCSPSLAVGERCADYVLQDRRKALGLP